jgi:hypothetical protein
MRNSGAVFSACPGLFCLKPSPNLCVRCSGTNCSRTTTLLLPVPCKPETCQSSFTSKSRLGTKNVRRSCMLGLPSSFGAKAPSMAQSQWSTPLLKPHSPLST